MHELTRFHEANRQGEVVHHTDESYATGIGQVLLSRSDDGEFQITLVISASVIATILADEASDDDKETYIHALHHELCHVHDDNQQIDAMPHVLLQECLEGKRMYTYGPATLCWAEYFACFKSASTVTESNIQSNADAVVSSIRDAEARARSATNSFWLTRDIQNVHTTVTKCGDLVVRMCSYLLGYADGMGTTIEKIAPAAAEAIRSSDLSDDINRLHSGLVSIRDCYPDAWVDMSVYDDLALAMEGIYATLGIELTDQDDGRIWVEVL